MSKLYSPLRLGIHSLSHRVVLAPMTRLRSDQPSDAPGDLMAKFYKQRSSEGSLVIVEAPAVSLSGRAYLGAPGIYSDDQIDGWKKLADAIHSEGGVAYVQLFHAGRQSHPGMTGGTQPIAPSVMPYEGVALTSEGWVPTSVHRALELDEVAGVIEDFRLAAIRAKKAGFDGVELHAANGYLPDQFLQDNSNQRQDIYGGALENRARFLLDATRALISVWGADRVGVRISPSGQWGQMNDSNPEETFGYVAEKLDELGVAYLHVIEPRIKGDDTLQEGVPPVASAQLRKKFKGAIIAAGGFDGPGAEAIVDAGDADLVAFGRHFAANPDLPARLKAKAPLNAYDRSTFWGGDERGYTDYPTLEREAAS